MRYLPILTLTAVVLGLYIRSQIIAYDNRRWEAIQTEAEEWVQYFRSLKQSWYTEDRASD